MGIKLLEMDLPYDLPADDRGDLKPGINYIRTSEGRGLRSSSQAGADWISDNVHVVSDDPDNPAGHVVHASTKHVTRRGLFSRLRGERVDSAEVCGDDDDMERQRERARSAGFDA